MQSKDLKQWIIEWKNVSTILLWGYGKNCKLHFQEIEKKYKIEAIIDNDKEKEGKEIKGIPVVFSGHLELINKKIVITTHYEEISAQLEAKGLKEYVDFCDMRILISAGSWYYHKELILSEVHIALTTACTLNCKYCNMYMPFHKKHAVVLEINELKEQLKLLFSYVDRITNLVLIGGETLLYKDLDKAISFISEFYREKVGNIEIVTNGTILPNQKLLNVLRENRVLVSLSNYQLGDEYNKKFEEVKKLLIVNDIGIYINEELRWKDFTFPYSKLSLSDQQAYKNMNLCNPVFRGFNDSKLYFCHLVWSADKAGIYEEKETDYIDLKKLNIDEREKIVRFNICCMDSEHISLCKECGGCSNLNQNYIPVGQQI